MHRNNWNIDPCVCVCVCICIRYINRLRICYFMVCRFLLFELSEEFRLLDPVINLWFTLLKFALYERLNNQLLHIDRYLIYMYRWMHMPLWALWDRTATNVIISMTRHRHTVIKTITLYYSITKFTIFTLHNVHNFIEEITHLTECHSMKTLYCEIKWKMDS